LFRELRIRLNSNKLLADSELTDFNFVCLLFVFYLFFIIRLHVVIYRDFVNVVQISISLMSACFFLCTCVCVCGGSSVSGFRVGIKSIQQNERFQSMATSLQTITASVRETLIDTLTEDWDSSEVRDSAEVDSVWSSEDKEDRGGGGEGQEESVESIASLQSSDDRGSLVKNISFFIVHVFVCILLYLLYFELLTHWCRSVSAGGWMDYQR